MQTIRSRTIAALGAFIATTVSIAGVNPAHAATFEAPAGAQVWHSTVSLAGIDMASPGGKAILDQRIRAAATLVCGGIDRAAPRSFLLCRRQAIADARARLNAVTMQQLAAR
jgi:UrcA family protein